MNSIDAVISWIDGYDPVYQQKLKTFCQQQGVDQNTAIEPTRIQQCNEIHYCLHALRRFAPWLRTIYLITNQQIPSAVTALQDTEFGQKIKIIDQNDLLREFNRDAPVFNSLSVEWLIWRIKGLSPQFLYLNDDFFIIREVTPSDFFRDNRMVLRGKWKIQAEKKWFHQLKQRLGEWKGTPAEQVKTDLHRAWQEKSARLAGWHQRFYLLPHAPLLLVKETFESCIAHAPDLFSNNIAYPFRHPEQVSSIPLMIHLDIKASRITYDKNPKTIMVNGACHSLKKIKSRLHKAHRNQRIAFVCMQSMDQAATSERQYMLDWLQQHIFL